MNFKDTQTLDQALNAMQGNCTKGGGRCSCHTKESPTVETSKRVTPASALTSVSTDRTEGKDRFSSLLEAMFAPYMTNTIASYNFAPAQLNTKEIGMTKMHLNEDAETLTLTWSDDTKTIVNVEWNYINNHFSADIEKAFAQAIMFKSVGIYRVIQQDKVTVILWNSGEKTVVKCQSGDEYDPDKGMYMAFAKYMLGNDHKYYDIFKKCIPGL